MQNQIWRPLTPSNLDQRRSLFWPVTEGVGDINRRKRCPFVRLSVCCTPLKRDLCAGHLSVGGSVLYSRRRWHADSILAAEAWIFRLARRGSAAPAKGSKRAPFRTRILFCVLFYVNVNVKLLKTDLYSAIKSEDSEASEYQIKLQHRVHYNLNKYWYGVNGIIAAKYHTWLCLPSWSWYSFIEQEICDSTLCLIFFWYFYPCQLLSHYYEMFRLVNKRLPQCLLWYMHRWSIHIIWPSYELCRSYFVTFCSASALLAMQSAVLARGILSVRLSVCPSVFFLWICFVSRPTFLLRKASVTTIKVITCID